MEIQTENLPLRLLLMKWWMQRRHYEVQKLILDTLPIIIYWNSWKNMYNAKYGAKTSSLTRVHYSISSNINILLRAKFSDITWSLNWDELYTLIEDLKHRTTTSKVS